MDFVSCPSIYALYKLLCSSVNLQNRTCSFFSGSLICFLTSAFILLNRYGPIVSFKTVAHLNAEATWTELAFAYPPAQENIYHRTSFPIIWFQTLNYGSTELLHKHRKRPQFSRVDEVKQTPQFSFKLFCIGEPDKINLFGVAICLTARVTFASGLRILWPENTNIGYDIFFCWNTERFYWILKDSTVTTTKALDQSITLNSPWTTNFPPAQPRHHPPSTRIVQVLRKHILTHSC